MWLALRKFSGVLWGMRQAPSLPLPRVHHVTLLCNPREVDACRAFYQEVLGLTEISSPIDKTAWYAEGIHLYWGGPPTGNDPHEDPPPNHVAIVLGKEYIPVVEVCKRWNMYLYDASQYWGSPRCFIRDPGGNRIELMQFAPPS